MVESVDMFLIWQYMDVEVILTQATEAHKTSLKWIKVVFFLKTLILTPHTPLMH